MESLFAGSSVAERLCITQAVLGSIPGGDQIFLILYCLKKACERERIHLMRGKKHLHKILTWSRSQAVEFSSKC